MDNTLKTACRYADIDIKNRDQTKEMEAVLEDVRQSCPAKFVWTILDLEKTASQIIGTDPNGNQTALSGTMARTMLKDCDQAVLMAGTLGMLFEQKLKRAQMRSMKHALLINAAGAAWIDEEMDRLQKDIEQHLTGQYLTDRFSPGYGDLPLELQKDVHHILDLQRRLGLHLLPSLLLAPEKTITAFAGIAAAPQPQRIRGCACCQMKDCQYKKKGTTCHGTEMETQ